MFGEMTALFTIPLLAFAITLTLSLIIRRVLLKYKNSKNSQSLYK
jgi:hypothetical protein